MRKVIDLCLDMPDFAEDLVRTACHFCLPEHKTAWAGYRQSFNGGIEKKLGMTFAELDALLENEGREAFIEKVTAAANANAPTLDDFVKEMDALGVRWGITCHNSHDNDKTAEIVRKYPDRFGGSNCQAKCNSLVEKANRRNKANTLTKIQKLKILDAATPRIFKITQKLKLISYFIANCTVLCDKHFLLI